MCFFGNPQNVPEPRPVPSYTTQDARDRREDERRKNQKQRGRMATVLTSPLGDPDFGSNINRTVLTGA